MELLYHSAISFGGIYPKGFKFGPLKDTHTPIFTAKLFIMAKRWKQPKCPPADEWVRKTWYCCGLCVGWERIPRHGVFQKVMSLLRTKSKDNEGTVSTEANLPTDQGETSSQFLWLLNWLFRLVANFCSLKTKEIPTGRVALGEWLGSVFLSNMGSVGGVQFKTGGLMATVAMRLSQFQRWPWCGALPLGPRYKASHLWPWYRALQVWRRKWQPAPVLLPGKSHGKKSLVGYSPWGRKELDATEWLNFHFQTFCRY